MYELIAQAPNLAQGSIREYVLEGMAQEGAGQIQACVPMAVDDNPLSTEVMGPAEAYHDDGALLHNSFMRAPSKLVIDNAIGDFMEHTSNSAMAVGSCAVCARETSRSELASYRLDCFPSGHWLQPLTAHPRHDIFNGMLLHPAGLIDDSSANVCMECYRALSSDRLPAFALANGMWIGDTPHELAYLTLPERLLIAKYYPAAYIIKLYPKKKGARHWDKRQMYSGLKGNVSTYQLDQGQIVSMIDGTTMPQQSRVLAATIGITFVGPKNLPDKGLPDMFKVRRARVRMALKWLKENNPIFSNIIISESRLSELPEDDVPYELRVTTKYSSDVSALYAEHDGYVPSQDGPDCADEGGKLYEHHRNHGSHMTVTASNASDDEGRWKQTKILYISLLTRSLVCEQAWMMAHTPLNPQSLLCWSCHTSVLWT